MKQVRSYGKWQCLIISYLLATAIACKKEASPTILPVGRNNTWVIPQEEVLRGAAKDGIRSIDRPLFKAVAETSFLREGDRLLVLAMGEVIKAYPIQILNWHEIVNDRIDDYSLTVTYCPLTGTGIAWMGTEQGQELQFGVSGLLYQANMIAYDRTTDSNWSQMRLQCVNGSKVGTALRQQVLLTLRWDHLKSTYPDAQVLSDQTGFDLPYSSYPYGDYRENHDFYISPVSFDDHRRLAKEEMLGIILVEGTTVFPRSSFSNQEATLLNIVLGGQPLVLYFNPMDDIMVAFKSNLAGKVHQFSLDQQKRSHPLVDENGLYYDIFGRQLNGDSILKTPKMYSGFWFAWTKFYPRVEIYTE